MHKNRFLMIFISVLFSFVCVLMFSSCISAKTVSSHDFSISVGDDNYAYALAQSVVHEGQNKQQLYLNVKLNEEVIPGEEDIYNFVWTHKFEIYLDGDMVLEELDVMPSKDGDSYEEDAEFATRKSQLNVYFNKEGYMFVNYDIDPTETYTVKFYNSFTCVDCPDSYEYKEQVLDVIELELVVDVISPTLKLDGLYDVIEESSFNGIGVNKVVNGTEFSVDVSDEGSGIKEAYYVVSSIGYT